MSIKRLEYIDAFRGLAIIFIVFGHIPLYSYGESGNDLISYRLFTSMVQLPMFFFVSGFLFVNNTNLGGVKIKLQRKFRQLLIPTFLFGGIFILCSNGNVIECLNDKFKYGYWFTLTLFEFFVLQYAVSGIWKSVNGDLYEYRYAVLCAIAAIMVYGLSLPAVENKVHGIPAVNWLGFPQLRYYIYFVIGHLLRLHLEEIIKWKYRDTAVAIAVTAFLILSILQWGLHWTAKGVLFHFTLIVFETCALLSIFTLFYKHRNKFDVESTWSSRCLSFIGKRTLDIYLLHYFFLPKDMAIVGEYFSKHSDMAGEMIVSGVMALTVIAICLIVGEMIRASKILSRWALGTR